MGRAVDFRLMLVTDRFRVSRGLSLPDAVAEALAGGVDAVQLREKDLSAAELLVLAEQLRELTGAHGAKLIVNGRLDVALAAGADGVHLGGDSIPAEVARRLLGEELLVGVSAHSVADVQRASRVGADYATFGPVYATPSKASFGPPQGLDALRDACSCSSLPVFAIGGLTPDRATAARAAGARVAAIAALLGSGDPRTAAAAFRREVDAP